MGPKLAELTPEPHSNRGQTRTTSPWWPEFNFYRQPKLVPNTLHKRVLSNQRQCEEDLRCQEKLLYNTSEHKLGSFTTQIIQSQEHTCKKQNSSSLLSPLPYAPLLAL